jgi:hypothetical protein
MENMEQTEEEYQRLPCTKNNTINEDIQLNPRPTKNKEQPQVKKSTILTEEQRLKIIGNITNDLKITPCEPNIQQ